MLKLILKLISNWFMVRTMVKREFMARYAGSAIGIFWGFIHPLMLTGLYTLIFSVFFKMKIQRMGVDALPDINFAVWFLTGLLPWNLFSETVTSSANAIRTNSQLIKKTLFPSEILPFTSFLLNAITHGIGIGILIIIMLITKTSFSPSIVMLPFYFLLVLLFSVGIGWVISSVNVFLRDIGQILGIVLQVWFFLTPVFYQASLIEKTIPALLKFYKINPFFFIVESYRGALIGQYSAAPQWGFWYPFYCVALGVAVFLFGAFLFNKIKPSFADVL